MVDTSRAWDGDEWEEHCLELLRARYRPPSPHQFQRVPSDDQGDCGIEGYSTDGILYQCYAPDAAVPIRDRYERQRDKLTRDIGTLIAKAAVVQGILGEVTITRYIYLVPRHDSRELNAHAKRQEQRLRAAGLAFIADDTLVLIATDDDYPLERRMLLNERLGRLDLPSGRPDDAAVDAFLEGHPARIETMRAKLSSIPHWSEGRVQLFERLLVKEHVWGESAVGELLDQHPAGYEQLFDLRTAKEAALPGQCLIATDPPHELMRRMQGEFAQTLSVEMSYLRSADIEAISQATLAEWLMDCPLQFHNV